jgi:shikimate dehydrogenase
VTAQPGSRRRCGVLGSPISHSLSPALHRAAYRHLGLDWSYTAHEIREDELAAFLTALDESWRGLSLTMPLKRVALQVAAEVSELARVVGAANTLVQADDGSWSADNTDVPGMVAAIQDRSRSRVAEACVWGGGATAASAVAALAMVGAAKIHLHARDAARAAGPLAVAGAADVTLAVLPWEVAEACSGAALVVSTVPAGVADAMAEPLAEQAGPERLLFDVVYDPWPTALAAEWEKRGGAVASGLDLLVHQAVGQLKLMTGHDVPPGVLYAAVS